MTAKAFQLRTRARRPLTDSTARAQPIIQETSTNIVVRRVLQFKGFEERGIPVQACHELPAPTASSPVADGIDVSRNGYLKTSSPEPAADIKEETLENIRRSTVRHMRFVSHPVAIVTSTNTDGSKRGATISSFNTVTVAPEPVVSLNLQRPSLTLDAIESSGHFLIHILQANAEAAALSQKFTHGNSKSPFMDLGDAFRVVQCPSSVDVGKALPPLIEDADREKHSSILFALRCEYLRAKSVEIGDHSVLFGCVREVHEMWSTLTAYTLEMQSPCLVYAKRQYGRVHSLVLPPQEGASQQSFPQSVAKRIAHSSENISPTLPDTRNAVNDARLPQAQLLSQSSDQGIAGTEIHSPQTNASDPLNGAENRNTSGARAFALLSGVSGSANPVDQSEAQVRTIASSQSFTEAQSPGDKQRPSHDHTLPVASISMTSSREGTLISRSTTKTHYTRRVQDPTSISNVDGFTTDQSLSDSILGPELNLRRIQTTSPPPKRPEYDPRFSWKDSNAFDAKHYFEAPSWSTGVLLAAECCKIFSSRFLALVGVATHKMFHLMKTLVILTGLHGNKGAGMIFATTPSLVDIGLREAGDLNRISMHKYHTHPIPFPLLSENTLLLHENTHNFISDLIGKILGHAAFLERSVVRSEIQGTTHQPLRSPLYSPEKASIGSIYVFLHYLVGYWLICVSGRLIDREPDYRDLDLLRDGELSSKLRRYICFIGEFRSELVHDPLSFRHKLAPEPSKELLQLGRVSWKVLRPDIIPSISENMHGDGYSDRVCRNLPRTLLPGLRKESSSLLQKYCSQRAMTWAQLGHHHVTTAAIERDGHLKTPSSTCKLSSISEIGREARQAKEGVVAKKSTSKSKRPLFVKHFLKKGFRKIETIHLCRPLSQLSIKKYVPHVIPRVVPPRNPLRAPKVRFVTESLAPVNLAEKKQMGIERKIQKTLGDIEVMMRGEGVKKLSQKEKPNKSKDSTMLAKILMAETLGNQDGSEDLESIRGFMREEEEMVAIQKAPIDTLALPDLSTREQSGAKRPEQHGEIETIESISAFMREEHEKAVAQQTPIDTLVVPDLSERKRSKVGRPGQHDEIEALESIRELMRNEQGMAAVQKTPIDRLMVPDLSPKKRPKAGRLGEHSEIEALESIRELMRKEQGI